MTPLSGWIDPSHLGAGALDSLAQRFAAAPAVIPVHGFLRNDRASALATALRAVGTWHRMHCIRDAACHERVLEVEQEQFAATPQALRFSRHDVVRPTASLLTDGGPLDPEGRCLMNEFFEFALGAHGLRTWLASWMGVELGERFSCEVVRYSSGDFIAEHSDAHDGRIVGLTLYLDPDWTGAAGGELLFGRSQRLEPACTPRFNTLALIPIAGECRHAVSPWHGQQPGRHGISLAYHPMRAGEPR